MTLHRHSSGRLQERQMRSKEISSDQWLMYDADSGGKHLVDTIKVNKPKLSEDGGTISVTFSGTRKDKKHKTPVRNAEIAFINEYGKKGQAARPFVRTANTRAEERIQKAGQAVWDEWTKTHLKGEN